MCESESFYVFLNQESDLNFLPSTDAVNAFDSPEELLEPQQLQQCDDGQFMLLQQQLQDEREFLQRQLRRSLWRSAVLSLAAAALLFMRIVWVQRGQIPSFSKWV